MIKTFVTNNEKLDIPAVPQRFSTGSSKCLVSIVGLFRYNEGEKGHSASNVCSNNKVNRKMLDLPGIGSPTERARRPPKRTTVENCIFHEVRLKI